MRLLIESLFEFELQSDMGEDTWKTYIGDHIQASRLAGWRVVLHSTSPSALYDLGFVRLDAANVDELLNVVS